MQITGMAPLLQVFDMGASLAFYRGLLGFAVVATSAATAEESDWVMLQLGSATLMLNTAYERDRRPAAPDPTRQRAHRDTALFFGCVDADECYARLKTKGWPAREPYSAPYGMRQVYTQDPDGFEICFQHPVKSQAAATGQSE